MSERIFYRHEGVPIEGVQEDVTNAILCEKERKHQAYKLIYKGFFFKYNIFYKQNLIKLSLLIYLNSGYLIKINYFL